MNKEETNEQLPQPLTYIIQHCLSIVKYNIILDYSNSL